MSLGQSLCYFQFNYMLIQIIWFIYSPVYSVLFGLDFSFKLWPAWNAVWWTVDTIAGSPLNAFLFGPYTQSSQFLHLTLSLSLLLLHLYLFASPYLHHSLSLSPPANQLNQTVESTSCPSGGCAHPFLSVLSLSRAHTLCSLPVSPAWETILERKREQDKEKHGMRLGGLTRKKDEENNVEQRRVFQLSRNTSEQRRVCVMKGCDTWHTQVQLTSCSLACCVAALITAEDISKFQT